jgi:hypothetical protein
MKELENLNNAETHTLNIPDVRLHYILHQFGYDYISNKNLFNNANLKWFYQNLQVRNRRHELYLEAIDRIEVLINKA